MAKALLMAFGGDHFKTRWRHRLAASNGPEPVPCLRFTFLFHIVGPTQTASPDARVLPDPEVRFQHPSFFQRLFGRRHEHAAAPLVYNAEDIAEDNRISDALDRQHAPR